jgi:hypothetical protein
MQERTTEAPLDAALRFSGDLTLDGAFGVRA